MGAREEFDAFMSDGSLVRPALDIKNARAAGLPRETLVVAPIPPHRVKELERDEVAMAQRHRAREVERAERHGRPVVEFGPEVTWMVQGEVGQRELVTGRLSQLRRAIPDQAEVMRREHAGIHGRPAPLAIARVGG